MGAVDDEGGGDKALHPDDRRHDLLLRGVVLRQMGRAQHHQPQTAGEVAGVDHCDILKGFCRLQGVLIAAADVPGHGDVDYILGLCQPLGKEPLVVLHIRGLGIPLTPLSDVHE